MKKKFNILNIDGVNGIGKTTQINMLVMSLRAFKPVLVTYQEDTIESALDSAVKIWEFLEKHPDGLVLGDGSIARMIVIDILNGIPRPEVVEKYRSVISEYERLNHKYGILSVLMVTDDIGFCHDRLIRRGKLLKKPEVGIDSLQKEAEIMKGMRYFDANSISKQLVFQVFEVDKEDSMLDIQDIFWEYLEDSFEIKKPS